MTSPPGPLVPLFYPTKDGLDDFFRREFRTRWAQDEDVPEAPAPLLNVLDRQALALVCHGTLRVGYFSARALTTLRVLRELVPHAAWSLRAWLDPETAFRYTRLLNCFIFLRDLYLGWLPPDVAARRKQWLATVDASGWHGLKVDLFHCLAVDESRRYWPVLLRDDDHHIFVDIFQANLQHYAGYQWNVTPLPPLAQSLWENEFQLYGPTWDVWRWARIHGDLLWRGRFDLLRAAPVKLWPWPWAEDDNGSACFFPSRETLAPAMAHGAEPEARAWWIDAFEQYPRDTTRILRNAGPAGLAFGDALLESWKEAPRSIWYSLTPS